MNFLATRFTVRLATPGISPKTKNLCRNSKTSSRAPYLRGHEPLSARVSSVGLILDRRHHTTERRSFADAGLSAAQKRELLHNWWLQLAE